MTATPFNCHSPSASGFILLSSSSRVSCWVTWLGTRATEHRYHIPVTCDISGLEEAWPDHYTFSTTHFSKQGTGTTVTACNTGEGNQQLWTPFTAIKWQFCSPTYFFFLRTSHMWLSLTCWGVHGTWRQFNFWIDLVGCVVSVLAA